MSLIGGVAIPDSNPAREISEVVRDNETPPLFHHSSRVYYFGALAGKHRGLKFDLELLYAGAMFHDMGLTRRHSTANERFEVHGANAARDFLRGYGISEADVDTVWAAIAHTTPGIPQQCIRSSRSLPPVSRWMSWDWAISTTATPSARRSSTPTSAPSTSRKTSSKPSTTAYSTSPIRLRQRQGRCHRG